MIRVYDSMTGKKHDLETLTPNEVKMYVCGPTVYDFLHVGNFRGPIFFNLVRNWLEKSGYKVTYVYNYTDVDDKIIDRANKEGVSSSEISERYIKEFEKDYNSLKLGKHSHNPKVTEFMDQIVALVKQLIEVGKAYEVDGDVYYNVTSFSEYGKLSHKKLDDLEAGSRIEVDQRKKHSADFALWKKAKPGEPAWPSPWSEGRPGWHIECSAMAKAILGDQIDIHGGGLDLIFPHHENEVAQSEGATGKTFAKYWMHNNMLTFGSQKMSKSVGNIKKARDFIEEYGPEILKTMMLSSHYRSLLDFSDDHIQQIIQMLGRVYSSLAHAVELTQSGGTESAQIPPAFANTLQEFNKGISASLNDDFNTAEAFGKIFDLVRSYNNFCRKPGKITGDQIRVAKEFLREMSDVGTLLSLFREPPKEFLKEIDDMLLNKKGLKREDIDALISERITARKSKDFAKSDALRDQIVQLGIQIFDTADGQTTWEVSKS